MGIEHNVFIDGALIKSFTSSDWYDTATPYQFCIAELLFLKHRIEKGDRLEINSRGQLYIIDNLDSYKAWMQTVFGGGFEQFVFKE
jgi:hypothetical protein